MLVVIACPECGHLGRVPEKRLGHKVRCKGCGGTFRPDAAATHASPVTKKFTKKDLSSKKTGEARPESGFLGFLKRPTIIEGAVLGAIAGIITGVIMGAITGWNYAVLKPAKIDPQTQVVLESASGGRLGSALGGGILGFIMGFIGGAPVGALIGLVGVFFESESFSKSWGRIVAYGILIGAVVTTIILVLQEIPVRHRYGWVPLGAALGAGGAFLWRALQNWEKSSDVPVVRDFQWEEEEKPTDPKTDL